jgi:hypothetical protein
LLSVGLVLLFVLMALRFLVSWLFRVGGWLGCLPLLASAEALLGFLFFTSAELALLELLSLRRSSPAADGIRGLGQLGAAKYFRDVNLSRRHLVNQKDISSTHARKRFFRVSCCIPLAR